MSDKTIEEMCDWNGCKLAKHLGPHQYSFLPTPEPQEAAPQAQKKRVRIHTAEDVSVCRFESDIAEALQRAAPQPNSTAPERPKKIEGWVNAHAHEKIEAYMDALETTVAQLRAEIAKHEVFWPCSDGNHRGCAQNRMVECACSCHHKPFPAPLSERDAQEGK